MRALRYQYQIDRAGGAGPHPWTTNMDAFKTALTLADATGADIDLEVTIAGATVKVYAFNKGLIIERAKVLAGQPAGHGVHSVVMLWLGGEWTDSDVETAVVNLFSATSVHSVIIDRTDWRE